MVRSSSLMAGERVNFDSFRTGIIIVSGKHRGRWTYVVHECHGKQGRTLCSHCKVHSVEVRQRLENCLGLFWMNLAVTTDLSVRHAVHQFHCPLEVTQERHITDQPFHPLSESRGGERYAATLARPRHGYPLGIDAWKKRDRLNGHHGIGENPYDC